MTVVPSPKKLGVVDTSYSLPMPELACVNVDPTVLMPAGNAMVSSALRSHWFCLGRTPTYNLRIDDGDGM